MLPAHIRREAVAGEDNIPQLNLIIKANTHGSAEAVAQAIAGVESKEITTKIILGQKFMFTLKTTSTNFGNP